MQIFKLEHSKMAYRADFLFYFITVLLLAAFLLVDTPHGQRVVILAFALAGLLSWTAIEYGMHRFILHGWKLFSRLHEEHHQRPRALIFTPTILSAALIALLVFVPVLLASGFWRACALTLGVLTGYLAYTVTHHAVHHWHFDNAWLKKRKRLHALHHYSIRQTVYYGVTSEFWDRVFGSIGGTVGKDLNEH